MLLLKLNSSNLNLITGSLKSRRSFVFQRKADCFYFSTGDFRCAGYPNQAIVGKYPEI